MKICERFKGGVIAVGLLCLLAGPSLAAVVTVIPQNAEGYFARDNNNQNLPAGSYIQLIAGSPVTPLATGEPGAGNTLLATNTLNGSGLYYFVVNGITVGSTVYLRVWNTTSWPPAVGTYYGNSGTHVAQDKAPLPDEWLVNQHIDADYRIATTTGIQPASRGQGAQGQLITVEGQYFEPGATINFSPFDNMILSGGTTTYGGGTRIHQILSINPAATTGGRSVTVTNPGAIASNAQTFTVNPGPHPSTPSPSSLYRGDSGQTVTIGGTGFHSNATVTLSGSGINHATNWDSATQMTLGNFQIAPSAVTGARTVTVYNPNDAGQDTTTFTVRNPTIEVSPLSGYLGNVFAPVTVTGYGTHFLGGSTSVTMASDSGRVRVGNTSVASPTSLTFDLAVSPEATTGDKTVTITTVNVLGETEERTATFTLNPLACHSSPLTGPLGTTVTLTLAGTETHFNQDLTTVAFNSPAGLTIRRVTVASPTALTVEVEIASGAATTARSVSVTTINVVGGTETLTCPETFQPVVPTLPGQVTNLRALAEPATGSITLRWLNPGSNYTGARFVRTTNYTLWDSLTKDSTEGQIDLDGSVGAISTSEVPGLDPSKVYYFKVFSYVTSGIQFFNPNGVKVAAIPMAAGGGGPAQLTFVLTLESNVNTAGGHGINHFALPFPSPWYVDGVRLQTAYDLVKAINTAAGARIVSTFAKWVSPRSVPSAVGIKLPVDFDPDNLDAKAALQDITLGNGVSYQVYLIQPVTLVIKNF
ncbi:MAG: hypothetical protein MUC35_03840 [Candidatus Margulisbacteria bacterium]|jgi:hypothetical protein|nr:hypothetical protein [Candidatus Margulisiibacteriota bacterium]